MSDRFHRPTKRVSIWYEKIPEYGYVLRYVNGHPIDFVKYDPPLEKEVRRRGRTDDE